MVQRVKRKEDKTADGINYQVPGRPTPPKPLQLPLDDIHIVARIIRF